MVDSVGGTMVDWWWTLVDGTMVDSGGLVVDRFWIVVDSGGLVVDRFWTVVDSGGWYNGGQCK